ncbi:MAG: transglycosylase SLT domain-containing protein [Bacteroidales bacterium]|jgi:hypothetical protein
MSLKNIIISIVTVAVIVLALLFGTSTITFVQNAFGATANNVVTLSQAQLKTITPEDVINMTEDDFFKLKEQYLVKMIVDSAKTNNINPLVLCGLAWHESSKFKFANKKIMDSNKKWSYGLFMVQLETALLYDKTATEEKLLMPTYNTHIAIVNYLNNRSKYKTDEMAIAAHNAGTIYNKKIVNVEFVKLVKTAMGDMVLLYNL